MNLPAQLFPSDLLWLANFLFAVLLGKALWRAQFSALLSNQWRVHALVGLTIWVFLFWQLSAGVRPGFNFHLIGATLLLLLFGRHVAIVLLSLVMTATFWRNGFDFLSLGLNGLVMIALPVYFSEQVLHFSQRNLPKNLFMFVLGNGFACAGAAMTLIVLTASFLLAAFTSNTWDNVLHNYLVFSPVIILVEAFTNGVLTTAFTVFAPQCVLNFNDKDYLHGK